MLQAREQRAKSREQKAESRLWIRRLRSGVVLAAATAALIAVSAVVRGPWALRVFRVQLFSVANPVKPLTLILGLVVMLALTSRGLRHACAARSAVGFYAVAAFITWVFSLGPAPTLMGKPLLYRGPYAALMLFPGFNALRVPARFWMMTTLCLAIVGAILFDRLAAALGPRRLIAAVIVSLGVLADGWVTDFPLAKTPEVWTVEACKGTGALMELPLGDPFRDVAAMYRGMSHGRPLINGYSGFFPPHYAALRFGLGLRDDDVLTQLAAIGVTDVVVDSARDGDGTLRQYVLAHPGTKAVCSEQGRTLYRLINSTGNRPSLAVPAGTRVPIATVRANVNEGDEKFMLDGDRTTRWQSGPQSDRTEIDIDLGGNRSIRGLQMLLGPFVEDFPRAFSIEVLGEGAVWRELYRGGTAGRAFVGAFQSPRDVPLTFEFPAVTTRYVRLRTLVNDETYYWSIAELKVLG